MKRGQSMKKRYLRAFIVLLAGLITSILNIINHRDVIRGLSVLLVVLLVFYVVGTLAQEIIEKMMVDSADYDHEHQIEVNKKAENKAQAESETQTENEEESAKEELEE